MRPPYFISYFGYRTLDAIAKLVEDGALRVEIQEVMPLAEARAALEKVMTGHTRGKIVLKVS